MYIYSHDQKRYVLFSNPHLNAVNVSILLPFADIQSLGGIQAVQQIMLNAVQLRKDIFEMSEPETINHE